MPDHKLEGLNDLAQDMNSCVGVAIDGSTAQVWYMAADLASQPGQTMVLDTSGFETFYDILIRIVTAVGSRPVSMVFAVPGVFGDDIMEIRGFEGWGDIDTFAIRLVTGIKVRFVTLLTARAIGARNREIEFHSATYGFVPKPGQRLYVVWSREISCVLELQRDGQTFYVPAASGRTTWAPETALERRYWRFLCAKYQTERITFDDAAGGSRGFTNACEFLLAESRLIRNWFRRNSRPRAELREQLGKSLGVGNDVGPVIDDAAGYTDPFAKSVIALVARIFGQHLRILVILDDVNDGVFLMGGVAAGLRFHQLYIEPRGVLDGMIGRHDRDYEPVVAETNIRYADDQTNHALVIRGAAMMALGLAAEADS